jgi:hypothetical protein
MGCGYSKILIDCWLAGTTTKVKIKGCAYIPQRTKGLGKPSNSSIIGLLDYPSAAGFISVLRLGFSQNWIFVILRNRYETTTNVIILSRIFHCSLFNKISCYFCRKIFFR